MKSQLIRSALLAAKRSIEDGNEFPDLLKDVREAHISIYDTEIEEFTKEDKNELLEAAELAGDLLSFAAVVQGKD